MVLAAVTLSSCAGPHMDTKAESSPHEQSNARQEKGRAGQSETTGTPTQDPTPGEWTETHTNRSDLDGELDEAWLDCAPHSNPDAANFAWKRASNHDGVWLHTTSNGSMGNAQLSCMDDELDIRTSSKPGSAWTVESFGDYERYQRESGGSLDVVWKYTDRVREALTVKADSYQVRLPYSWQGEFTAQVNGNDIVVNDREHPQYRLVSFTLVNPSSPVNAGDIASSLIDTVAVAAGDVQMSTSRWAYMAAMDPTSVDGDAVEDVTELQTGDSVDYDTLIAQVKSGDNSNLFKIDDYLKAHVIIEERG